MIAAATRGWLRAGLELSVASLLLAGALAALTGSPAIEAAAVAILAVGLCHAIMLRQSVHDASPGGALFWSFVAGALVLALASGVTVALLVRASAARATDWPLAMELGGLAILTIVQAGWLYWNLRDVVGHGGPLDLLPPGLVIADPTRAALLIGGVTGLVSAGIAFMATLAAWGLQQPLWEAGGALLIALALATAAGYFAFETRAVLEQTEVDPRLLKTLTEAIGAAAQKSGAIRRVVDVDARHAAPGTVIATVQLDFKEGVDARHVASVLATLHKAAKAAVPEVTALVLSAPPAAGPPIGT